MELFGQTISVGSGILLLQTTADLKKHMDKLTKLIPDWVKVADALALGLGTMSANRSGLRTETLRNLLLAWVLTLPVCVILGTGIFAFGFKVLPRMGIK